MCADNLLYRVTPQNVGCIIETVFHMIIELLSLLVNVISYFSVSPPWSPTLLICIFISSYVLSDYKKTIPFKLLWTLENYWTWWEIHFRTVTLTIITITIIIVIVMRIINEFFYCRVNNSYYQGDIASSLQPSCWITDLSKLACHSTAFDGQKV